MTLLLPSSQSNSYKSRRKPHKRLKIFTCNHPASFEDGKQHPVPVVIVNQDPLQEMEPDEYGAELGKEARVWRVYAKETDQWDADFVDNWNRSLDGIVVFAGLYSAVTTTFLIESSHRLQQDPNDVSAAALVTISRVLLTITNSSSADLSAPAILESDITTGFVPPRITIIVNTLWYLSLSLSITTSLLAMLAKHWVASFFADRTGHQYDRALRRQRKWTMIERWKMQEVMTIIPLLNQLSVLLFALGLCIYLWDMNVIAAIPIICVFGTASIFYVWSSITAGLVKHFPYTTILSRTLHTAFAYRQYDRIHRHGRKYMVGVLLCIRFVLKWASISLFYILLAAVAVICLPILPLDVFFWLWPGDYLPRRLLVVDGFEGILWLRPARLLAKFIWDTTGGRDLSRTIHFFVSRTKLYIKFASPPPSDHGEMTSLALKWLIQNCEAPSSVTVALQSLAGASSRIPNEPLKACQANLEIFRRLASSISGGSEGSEGELYVRALTFLESDTRSYPYGQVGQVAEMSQNTQARETTGDIQVAIWDLKAEHERRVVDLINSAFFRPTKENITALTMGNSATSLALRLLNGEHEAASQTFGSIMNLMLEHVQSGHRKLDPAAIHSLEHAAVVLSSCTPSSFLTHDLTQQWMEQCVLLLRKGSLLINTLSRPPRSNIALQPETVVAVCLLLNSYSTTQIASTFQPPHMAVAARVKCATHLFTNARLRSTSYQAAYFRVVLMEVLFHQVQERMGGSNSHYFRKEIGGNLIKSSYLLPWNDRYYLERPLNNVSPGFDDVAAPAVSEYLEAMKEIHEFVRAPRFNEYFVTCMPAPTYCMLIWITSRTRQYAQRALCEHLLSKTAFPQVDDYFLLTLESCLSDIWPSGLSDWNQQHHAAAAASYRFTAEDSFNARLRHFAAAQTWLFLCLVGDSSTSLQNSLKNVIGRHMYQNLGDEGHSIPEAKVVLEQAIIQSYEEGHHLGVYSARVIECIYQARGTPPDDELSQRIQIELKDVPRCIRGLSTIMSTVPHSSSATFLAQAMYTALPPSASSSLSSLHPEPEPIAESQSANHVSIPISSDKPAAGIA